MPEVNQIEVGVPCPTPNARVHARVADSTLASQLHPFCQQRPIVQYCKQMGIVVQAYSPLVQGKLDHPVLLRLADKVGPTPPSTSLCIPIRVQRWLALFVVWQGRCPDRDQVVPAARGRTRTGLGESR